MKRRKLKDIIANIYDIERYVTDNHSSNPPSMLERRHTAIYKLLDKMFKEADIGGSRAELDRLSQEAAALGAAWEAEVAQQVARIYEQLSVQLMGAACIEGERVVAPRYTIGPSATTTTAPKSDQEEDLDEIPF